MAWFKVDDRLTVSSKVMRIPRVMRIEAMGLWVMCGAWSARDLTDGFIPAYVVDELGGTNDITTALVEAGLWEADHHDGDDGFQFVNWAEYQPTKESIEDRRARDAERKRAQRRTESGQFASDSKDVQPESTQSPSGHDAESENVHAESAVPVPSRPGPSPVKTSSSTDVADAEFDTWWTRFPRKVGKGQARKAYRTARKKTDHQTLVDAITKQRDQLMAKGPDFCPHPTTWLNGERWADEPEPTNAAPEQPRMGFGPRMPGTEDEFDFVPYTPPLPRKEAG